MLFNASHFRWSLLLLNYVSIFRRVVLFVAYHFIWRVVLFVVSHFRWGGGSAVQYFSF